ncbi:hypothetical protein NKH92_23610 [Mesorhizobium sp. M0871]|uniref:hypothetical protein n=1 Tax=Mesorhizobium sp. M0871 TaxID=2957017 RepID=UPI00333AC39B
MNELAKGAAGRFRSAVRPIYGATENGTPNHIGSAVLFAIRGMKLLLTAAHVIDANEEMATTVYVGGTVRTTSKPNGDRDKDQYDFAVCRLPEEMIAQLGTGYVTEGDITTEVQAGHLYTAVGFPSSKNRWSDPTTRKTVAKVLSYSSTWRFDDQIAKRLAGQGKGEHHVFLGYKKHSRSDEGNQGLIRTSPRLERRRNHRRRPPIRLASVPRGDRSGAALDRNHCPTLEGTSGARGHPNVSDPPTILEEFVTPTTAL